MTEFVRREIAFTYTAHIAHGAEETSDLEATHIECLCEGFVRSNVIEMMVDPGAWPCCLGCSCLRYLAPRTFLRGGKWVQPVLGARVQPVLRGGKWVQPVLGARALMSAGMGTCIDLACFHAALLRLHGDSAARVSVVPQRADVSGEVIEGLYHAVVVTGSGERIDSERVVKAATPCNASCPQESHAY